MPLLTTENIRLCRSPGEDHNSLGRAVIFSNSGFPCGKPNSASAIPRNAYAPVAKRALNPNTNTTNTTRLVDSGRCLKLAGEQVQGALDLRHIVARQLRHHGLKGTLVGIPWGFRAVGAAAHPKKAEKSDKPTKEKERTAGHESTVNGNIARSPTSVVSVPDKAAVCRVGITHVPQLVQA